MKSIRSESSLLIEFLKRKSSTSTGIDVSIYRGIEVIIEVLELLVAIPVIRSGDILYVSPHFGRAPYIAFAEISEKSFKILDVVENPYSMLRHGRGRVITDIIAPRGVNAVIVIEIGEGAFNILKRYGVKIYRLSSSRELIRVEDALRSFSEGLIEEVEKPWIHEHEHEYEEHH
ncbi:MAG: NifB/NifX family molybdenum-iron cluster-binding protein [Sulfolobales archaeon]